MPIRTIIMISGVYMLIQVSVTAGLVDRASAFLSGSVPAALGTGMLVLFAAILSFFSSSTSTVMPLMYPWCPPGKRHGAECDRPVHLHFLRGLATAISPFRPGEP